MILPKQDKELKQNILFSLYDLTELESAGLKPKTHDEVLADILDKIENAGYKKYCQ